MAGATFAYPSSTSVFIPSTAYNAELSAQLVINFSRKPDAFPLNKYIKLVPVKKRLGYYKRILPYQSMRVTSSRREFQWNPGQDRPIAHWNRLPFRDFPFVCNREDYPTVIEYLEEQQADYPIKESHLAMVMQQAMTARTRHVHSVLQDTSNYLTSHVATATALGGGTWANATLTNRYIQATLDAVYNRIQFVTGNVKRGDLTVVMNPNVAQVVARSQEFASYLAQQQFSQQFLAGILQNSNEGWKQLPKTIYEMNLVVDDTVVFDDENPELSEDNETGTYAVDNNVYVLARPGDLVGSEGAVDFSSIHMFVHEELSVETFDDPKNRRIDTHVVDDRDVKMVSPPTTFRVSGIL